MVSKYSFRILKGVVEKSVKGITKQLCDWKKLEILGMNMHEDHVSDGELIPLRFIRSDSKLNIFGEDFQISKDLAFSYVKAVIVTSVHTLQVYLDTEPVDTFDYHLTF